MIHTDQEIRRIRSYRNSALIASYGDQGLAHYILKKGIKLEGIRAFELKKLKRKAQRFRDDPLCRALSLIFDTALEDCREELSHLEMEARKFYFID